MAKERLFFLGSFAFLGIIAALLFRHADVKEIKPPEQNKEEAAAAKPIVKEPEKQPEKPPEPVALPLTPGKIAVPFQLASTRSGIAQFLNQGMLVDIIFTSKGDVGFGTVSLTLLKYVRILEVGKDNTKLNMPVEILLEMTPRESEVFSYAQQTGNISLAIEEKDPPGDDSPLVGKLLKSESDENFNSILVTHMMRSLFPDTNIKVTATPKGYIVEGLVADTKTGDKILKVLDMLSSNGDKAVINLMEEGPAWVEVLVSIKDLKEGEHLNPNDYAWIRVEAPKANPSMVFRNPQSEEWLHESVLIKDIPKGQEINICDIKWPHELSNTPLEPEFLTPDTGKIAVPFPLPAKSLIIQFLDPGVLVDVKFASKLDIGIGMESLTLLRNLRVLAIKELNGKKFKGMSSFYNANPTLEIFLEMSPRQAEIFSYATQSGSVFLELSSIDHHTDKHKDLVELLLESESPGNFHSALVTHMIRTLFPNVKVVITATPKGYLVEGNVPDPQMAAKILEIIQKLVPDGEKNIVNMLDVEPQQVLICVRVFEVDKGISSRLGLNWRLLFHNAGATVALAAVYPQVPLTDPNYFLRGKGIHFGKFNFNALVDMLEEDGYAKLLAEPNLTTVSGETAHFFAGGEFPILVPQGGNLIGTVTIEYKKYGVLLDFTPTVDLNGLISMHVVPEVSLLDQENAVEIEGYSIPALTTRRVDTIVKLWPGQCYIIAGMFQDIITKVNDNLYGLHKIPIIGPFFSSQTSNDQQTELVVVVTPYLLNNECEADSKECGTNE